MNANLYVKLQVVLSSTLLCAAANCRRRFAYRGAEATGSRQGDMTSMYCNYLVNGRLPGLDVPIVRFTTCQTSE